MIQWFGWGKVLFVYWACINKSVDDDHCLYYSVHRQHNILNQITTNKSIYLTTIQNELELLHLTLTFISLFEMAIHLNCFLILAFYYTVNAFASHRRKIEWESFKRKNHNWCIYFDNNFIWIAKTEQHT